MKKNVFLVFILLAGNPNIYCQDIFVDLKITWQATENYTNIKHFKNRSMADIPFLSVKYSNRGDKNTYFLKPFSGFRQFPPTESSIPDDDEEVMSKVVLLGNTFEGKTYDYKLIEDNNSYFMRSWSISYEKWNFEAPPEMAAQYIAEIQVYLILQEELSKADSTYQLNCFNYPGKKYISYDGAKELIRRIYPVDTAYRPRTYTYDDFTAEGIENNEELKNYFMFLGAGEEYIEEYNLIGFQIVGANYNFIWNDTKSPSKVSWGDYYDPETGRARPHEAELPEKIGNYSLFDGDFIVEPVVLKLEPR